MIGGLGLYRARNHRRRSRARLLLKLVAALAVLLVVGMFTLCGALGYAYDLLA